MSIKEIIELAVASIVVLVLAIYYIIKAIKNNWLKQITATIEKAIKEAETSGKSGNEKKQLVLDAVQVKCADLGIPYALLKNLVSKLIDRIIKDYNILSK